MKNIFFLLAAFSSLASYSQYYYSDIISNREIEDRMKNLVARKVLTITATGFDANGTKATDFNEYQEVRENGKALKISTRNGFEKTILYYRFNDQGRIVSLADSSTDMKSFSTYRYDAQGNLLSIENTTSDTAMQINETEKHHWFYGSGNKPNRLLKILNNIDTADIRFTIDEDGNVADEKIWKRGRAIDSILYYYDDNNRLTDIVRWNKKAKKLLPDFMFEYDESNRVIQKITTISGMTISYLIWRYVYDDRGLKTKEALFDKNKQMTGKIEYSFSFSN